MTVHNHDIGPIRRTYRAIADRLPFVRTFAQATIIPAMGSLRKFKNVYLPGLGARILDYIHLRAAAELPGVGIGKRASGREIVMLVVSDLRIDPRVEREARALAEAGYKVRVICPDPTQGQEPDFELKWADGIEIEFLHWTAATYVMHRPGFLGIALFKEAIRHKPFAFHAHDLSTSYVAWAAARRSGAHLIVDFHEWVSENVHWDRKRDIWLPYDGLWKWRLHRLERRLIRRASKAITVCDSIADAMAVEQGGGKRPDVIRNIPYFSAIPTRAYGPLKQQLGLPPETFVVLYQGGTGPLRLLEPIISSLSMVPECTLVIRGPSLDSFGEHYKQIAEKVGARDRLILAKPVPSRDVVAAARGADAGIYSVVNLCRSFTMALPNKIFEYLAAGVPVLSANYPEARRIVEQNSVGLIFDPYDPVSIAGAIKQLMADSSLRQSFRENASIALANLDADAEWQKLVKIYDALPVTAGQGGGA